MNKENTTAIGIRKTRGKTRNAMEDKIGGFKIEKQGELCGALTNMNRFDEALVAHLKPCRVITRRKSPHIQ